MSTEVKTKKYGTVIVDAENFNNLSFEKQQELLKEAIAAGNIKAPTTDVGMGSGIVRSGLQGLTLGFSDEIGAGVGAAFDSVFTDQSFNEAFDKRVTDSRSKLKSFSKANPKTALAADITGSVAPVIASLLLTPFTGGASGTGVAATGARILSNPLLAGKIAKPGSGLLSKSFEAGKIGALQGGVAGAGYSDGSATDRAIGTGLGVGAGALIGGVTPSVLTGAGKVIGSGVDAVKNVFTKKSNFTKDETKAIKIIAEQFARDEISVEQVIQKIQDNVSADALEGITPIEILADYGGDAVIRKLRGINTRVPGMNIGEKLTERTTGTMEQKASAMSAGDTPNIQSTRIASTLEDTTDKTIETKGIDLQSGINDIVVAVDKKLKPLYDTAYAKNTSINNLEVYKYLESDPILKNAYSEAIKLYNQKIVARGGEPIAIPKLNKLLIKEKGKVIDVSQTLPLEFFDLIKRVADQKTYQQIIKGSINKQMAGPRKKIANNFRDLLKESVKGNEYINALNQAADNFALKDAYDLGAKFHKPSATAKSFNNEFSKLNTNAEKDAFRIGVFQEIMKDINKVGDSQDLVKKIFNSPDLRQKIFILFGNDEKARDQFINKLVREAQILRTTQTVTGGSNTAEKLFDADQASQTASDIFVAGNEPTGAAGIRSIFNLGRSARDIISNPLEKTSRNVGNILLEQNPNKQLEILELMQQLEKTGRIKNAYQNVLGGAAIRSGTNQLNQLFNQ
tara:strand:- start:10485 stop:12701 length:2217 start_codon:yes stop_codon:yes gene_type:complete